MTLVLVQVDSLLYQLNSDSEGDEGSDIGANEGREAEESSQQEEDAQGAEDYDDADMGQPEASKQPDGKYDKDKQQADIRSSSNAAAKASAQSEHHSPAEPLHKSNEVQTSPDSPNAAAAEISMKGAVPKTAETLTAASQPHQSSTHQAGCKHTLANPEAEQLGATGPSQQSGLATLPYDAEPASTAEAATLPYDAATGGLLATDQAGGNSQELPGGAAAQNVDTRKGDPVAAGISLQRSTPSDL